MGMTDKAKPAPKPEDDEPDGRLNDDLDNPTTQGSGAMPADTPGGDVDPGAG